MKPGLIFFFTLWLYTAVGTAYYVSPNGDDRNKGTKWVIPFKTIQKAALVARPGDTVNILKGDYYSKEESLLHIERSGTENDWIVFKNYLNHKPVLHVKNKYGIWIQSASYISIEGLTLTTESADLTYAGTGKNVGIFIDGNFQAPCTHLKIFNNFIQKMSGEGLFAQYFDYLVISFNKFFSNSGVKESKGGIYLKNAVDIDGKSVYHNFIQGNVFEKNGLKPKSDSVNCQAAMHFDYEKKNINSSQSNTLVHNNIIYMNAGGGILVSGALGFNIINNTLFKNSENCQEAEIKIKNCAAFNVFNNIFYSSSAKTGSDVLNSSDIRFQNNLYYNFSSMYHGENDKIANPEFEITDEKNGTYNFRLKGNSPAINAGIDEFLSDIDFEGIKRKIDTHVDMGALEFNNRILPSLKNTKAGPVTKGLQNNWSSIYTQDQKMYTIWNQRNAGFSIRVFDSQGNKILEKIRPETGEQSFEIDFNLYPSGVYSVVAFNSTSRHIERVRVQTRSQPQ